MKRLLLLLMQTCVVCHLSANRVLYQETHPDGETIYHGFWTANTGVWDWQNTKGLSLQCFSDGRQEEKVEVAFEAFNHVAGHAIIAFSGNGWHTLFVPWTRFDTNSAQLVAALRQVKSISVTDLNDSRHLKLRNVEAVDGEHISMRADVRGRSGKAGETVVYDFTITNISSERQVISLSIPTKGWEMMKAEIEPSVLTLDPNDKTICRLKVIIDGKLPAGNRERQTIVTTVNGMCP